MSFGLAEELDQNQLHAVDGHERGEPGDDADLHVARQLAAVLRQAQISTGRPRNGDHDRQKCHDQRRLLERSPGQSFDQVARRGAFGCGANPRC